MLEVRRVHGAAVRGSQFRVGYPYNAPKDPTVVTNSSS